MVFKGGRPRWTIVVQIQREQHGQFSFVDGVRIFVLIIPYRYRSPPISLSRYRPIPKFIDRLFPPGPILRRNLGVRRRRVRIFGLGHSRYAETAARIIRHYRWGNANPNEFAVKRVGSLPIRFPFPCCRAFPVNHLHSYDGFEKLAHGLVIIRLNVFRNQRVFWG